MHNSKKVFGCPERLFTLFTSFYVPLLRRSQLDFENPFPLIVVSLFSCIMSVSGYLSCDFKSFDLQKAVRHISIGRGFIASTCKVHTFGNVLSDIRAARSEERRVGKEC